MRIYHTMHKRSHIPINGFNQNNFMCQNQFKTIYTRINHMTNKRKSCVMTRFQPCKYCLFWTQRGPHSFKTRLQGYEESILIQCQELSPLSDVGCHKLSDVGNGFCSPSMTHLQYSSLFTSAKISSIEGNCFVPSSQSPNLIQFLVKLSNKIKYLFFIHYFLVSFTILSKTPHTIMKHTYFLT